MSSSPAALSYRALLATAGVPPLVAAALLARTALNMMQVGLVLFTLQAYHSPQLAGAVAFFSVAPGLIASPFAGALLDRRGRVGLMVLDYAFAGTGMALISLLSATGHLGAAALLAITGLASLTGVLSVAGTRSLLPVIVPRRLWDRANALDSGCFVVAIVLGPALAGTLIAVLGGPAALAVTAGVYAAAALVATLVRDPDPPAGPDRSLVHDAGAGLVYVLRNPSLRGLAASLCTFNIGFGAITIGLPVLVEDRLGSGPELVGALYAVVGVTGALAGLVAGTVRTEGRERPILAAWMLVGALGVLVVAVAPSVVVAALGMAVLGIANGPIDIALFGLRQRRTGRQWMGRAFAVSMALNFSGVPIGSALAGALVALSVRGTLVGAAVVSALAALIAARMIPGGPIAAALRPREPAALDNPG